MTAAEIQAEAMNDDKRCPYHSRAWGCRCDRPAGHAGDCCSAGDGFAGGWDPEKGEPGGPDDRAERGRLEARSKS
jgi:hypothetical protein